MKYQELLFVTLTLCWIYNVSPTITINSCGKLEASTNYPTPTKKEDCKPGGDDFQCCFVSVTFNSVNKKYCTFIPGKINDDVIKQFRITAEDSTATIECNNATFRKISSIMLFIVFAIFL